MKALSSLALLASSLGAVQAQTGPVRTVDHVDLQRYAGTWYELGRMPNRFEKKCARDVTANYRLDGDTVAVTNSCVKEDGSRTDAHGKAKIVDKATNAKLKVTFFWPFYGDYWILGLDPEYRWAVVGTPDRKYLWLLSRTKTLTPDQKARAMQVIQQNGYSPTSLVPTPQS